MFSNLVGESSSSISTKSNTFEDDADRTLIDQTTAEEESRGWRLGGSGSTDGRRHWLNGRAAALARREERLGLEKGE